MSSHGQLNYINSALEDTTTFGFNEIRLNPEYSELLSNNPKLRNTIDLFCFGTYSDYSRYRTDFIDLSELSLKKLRQLTIVSEALKSDSFSFQDLNQLIGNLSDEDFERLIVESIYSKVIDAKIFSKEKHIEINYTIGRDVLLKGEPRPKYGDVKNVADLLKGLEVFNNRIGKAFDYLNDVKQELNKDSSTPVKGSQSITGQSSELEPSTLNKIRNARKRKIDIFKNSPPPLQRLFDDEK